MSAAPPKEAPAPQDIPGLVEDSRFRYDTVLEFEHSALNALRDIWKAKTGGQRIASRAEFDARTLKPYWRHLDLLDVVRAPGGTRRYRHRFLGSALVEIFGELTGRYVDETIPPDRLARWAAGHDLIVMTKQPFRFVINYSSPPINFLRAECLAIPLSADGETVDMIMVFNYLASKEA